MCSMKRLILFFLTVLFLAQISAAGVFAASPDEQKTRKIVVFDKNFSNQDGGDALLKKYGVQKIKHLEIINSTVVNISPRTEALLKKEGSVLRIDEDAEVHALGRPAPPPAPTSQILPWGIDRIDAE